MTRPRINPVEKHQSPWLSAFVRRYINAAIGGNVGAQATLGYFYEVGEHVDADEREAIRWYEKAAENDHLQAR